jgi:hypothetical protein
VGSAEDEGWVQRPKAPPEKYRYILAQGKPLGLGWAGRPGGTPLGVVKPELRPSYHIKEGIA